MTKNPILFLIMIFVFITLSCSKEDPSNLGLVKDIEGNEYKTIKIGSQTWMAENLKTTKLNDGTLIPKVLDNIAWRDLTNPGFCYHSNNDSLKDIFGALYNWYAVNTGKLCPVGWHVPSNEEWVTLSDYLGKWDYNMQVWAVGGKLREVGTSHWESPNSGATNESGFTALPGSRRLDSGDFDDSIGSFAIWYGTTEEMGTYAASFSCGLNEQIGIGPIGKTAGCSVRCLKNN